MMIGYNIFSWEWASGLSKILGQLGSWLIDWIHSGFWALIHILANICDGVYQIINFIISPQALELFTENSTISKFYTASYYLGFFLVLIFAVWQIIKRNVEPDKAPPLSSILWETGKCVVIITIFLNIFNTVLSLTTSLQDAIPQIYSNNKIAYNEQTGETIYEENDSDVKFSSYIISSFITVPSSEKNLTNSDLIVALSRDRGSCNEKGLSFWGCEYTNYKNAGNFNLYMDSKSSYRKEIKSSRIDEKNDQVAPMYNWRDSVDASLLTEANHKKDYVFESQKFLLIISLTVFTVAMFFLAYSLVTRLLELIIILIISPAIIGTSICRQETRITLWKTLASLLLQSVGTMLILYLAISFMSTISTMNIPDVFVGHPFLYMLFKCILVFGLGMFMVQGSKVINAFISESAGMKEGLMGGIATIAAGYGSIKLAGTAAGAALKVPSGLSSIKSAVNTKAAAKGVANAEKALAKSTPENMADNQAKLNKALEKYDTARESGNKFNEDGSKKFTAANALSSAGDKLMGKKGAPLAKPGTQKTNATIERARNISSSGTSGGVMASKISAPSQNDVSNKRITNSINSAVVARTLNKQISPLEKEKEGENK